MDSQSVCGFYRTLHRFDETYEKFGVWVALYRIVLRLSWAEHIWHYLALILSLRKA